MLTFPAAVRVLLATTPIDMRGSFDAPAGHARGLGLSPEDGHLYVFVNARGTLMKAVFFDGTALGDLDKVEDLDAGEAEALWETVTGMKLKCEELQKALEGKVPGFRP